MLIQIFVVSEKAKIQELSNINNWHYVNTKGNPADIATRRAFTFNKFKTLVVWPKFSFLFY